METLMLALYTKIMLALYSKKLAKDEAGVTAIEYGLIAALVAVVCICGFARIRSP
jgi:Flp pilus assembly pilin Flp